MFKSQVRQHYSISNRYQLWVTMDSRPELCSAEGSKEEMNTPETLAKAETYCQKYWKREEAANKAMDEAQAKYPKKQICQDGNEILIYNKNGSVFKTLRIEY